MGRARIALVCGLLCGLVAIAAGAWFVLQAVQQPNDDEAGGPPDEQRARKLLKQLRDADPERRRDAAADLADFPELHKHADLVVPPLLDALKHKDNIGLGTFTEGAGSLRELVVEALRKAGPAGEKALVEVGLPVLLNGLEGEGEAVQDHTLRVFGEMGPLAERAIPTIERMTRSQNEIVRQRAFQALNRIGPGGLAVLLRLARQGDAARKRLVLDTFYWGVMRGARPPAAVVPALIDLLGDADPGVRGWAAKVLLTLGPAAAPAARALAARLDDGELHEALRRTSRFSRENTAVADALAAIGKPAVPVLVEALGHKALHVKASAIMALGQIGPKARAAAEPLRRCLQDDRLGVMVNAAVALLRIGDDPRAPVQILGRGLSDERAAVRGYVLSQLSELSPPPRELLPLVVSLLKDEQPAVVNQALRILVEHGSDAESALPQVIPLLDDPRHRGEVIRLVARFGPRAREAIPGLARCLKDPDSNVVRWAADALAKMGPAAAPAVPALREALQSHSSERGAVLRALGRIGAAASAAVPDMLKLLAESKEDGLFGLRFYVLQALAELGPHAREAVPDLVRLLRAGPGFGGLVVVALGSIGPAAKEAVPLLEARLKAAEGSLAAQIHGALAQITGDHPAHVTAMLEIYHKLPPGRRHHLDRAATWAALARLGKSARPALPTLIAALKAKPVASIEYSDADLEALGGLGAEGREAVPHLLTQLKEGWVDRQLAVMRTLGKIGPAAAAAIPLLKALSNDRNVRIREAARQALRAIDGGGPAKLPEREKAKP
jgi:HEAT repeat protein